MAASIWAQAVLFPWGDRDFMAIDTTATAYRGRIYYTATNVECATCAGYIGEIYSADNGKTYSSSVRVYGGRTVSKNAPDLNGGPVAVLASGHVMIVGYQWADSEDQKVIRSFVSTDSGQAFAKGVTVAYRTGTPLIGAKYNFKGMGASLIPLVATDTSTSPFRNRVYVAWQDFSNGAQASIMLAYSNDEGKTWSEPVQVDDAPMSPHRMYPIVFAPSLAVNDKGIVMATWYDARDVADGTGGTLRAAYSNDGGETFSASEQVANAASSLAPEEERMPLGNTDGARGLLQVNADTRYHVFGGDTQGLAADASGVFHPLWIDNRTGVAQLWTASVSVGAPPQRHGDPSLSSLRDITDAVDLDLSNAVYDRQARAIVVDVALWNSSKKPLRLPLRIRVARMSSVAGSALKLEQSDNGLLGPGAILTFDAAHGSVLEAGSETSVRHLRFSVLDPQPLDAAAVTSDALPVVKMNYRVYAAQM